MTQLTNRTPAESYNELLRVDGGLSISWKTVEDGLGQPMGNVEASVYGLRGIDIVGYAFARVVAITEVVLSGLPTIDGILLGDGETVLLTAQSAAKDNGLWLVSPDAWQRAAISLAAGNLIAVSEGDVNADSIWMLTTNNPFVLGVSPLTFQRVFIATTSYLFAYETTITGNGSDSVFTITHNLGAWVTHVTVQDANTRQEVLAESQNISSSQLTLTILPAPTVDEVFNVKVTA